MLDATRRSSALEAPKIAIPEQRPGFRNASKWCALKGRKDSQRRYPFPFSAIMCFHIQR